MNSHEIVFYTNIYWASFCFFVAALFAYVRYVIMTPAYLRQYIVDGRQESFLLAFFVSLMPGVIVSCTGIGCQRIYWATWRWFLANDYPLTYDQWFKEHWYLPLFFVIPICAGYIMHIRTILKFFFGRFNTVIIFASFIVTVGSVGSIVLSIADLVELFE
jgi:hypothetical protein